jgi:hypothetical protein
MTFSIGFCFLPGEKQEDFVWAFQRFQELGICPKIMVMDGDNAQKNASEVVFPDAPTLLCIWHVNQCVLANCKNRIGEKWKEFETGWRSVIQAPTVKQFESLWLEFKTQYSSTPETQYCVTYLQNEWLKPGQKERLVAAWTNQYLHFGVRTTSRVEGAHAYIKRYLGGSKSKGDLLSSWLHIEAAVINQIIAISIRTNQQRDNTPINVERTIYQGCFGVVSWHALRLVEKHLESISLPLRPCTGSFVRSMGLPCAHICDAKKETGLTPADFHEYWYWDRTSTLQPLLDPLWAGRRRIATTANAQISRTGRILSTGEELPIRQPPVCSACHRKGHTMSSRNCPLKLQASIASQSQALLDQEMAERPPTTTVSITASIPAFSSLDMPPFSSQVNLQLRISSSPPNTAVEQPLRIASPLTISPQQLELYPKQLAPGRPEALMQTYLAEKNAWLAQHPTVRPTNYRKARKLQNQRPKVLKEQAFYMPRERRDVATGKIIAEPPNWTPEEILVWLDYQHKLDEEEDKRLDAEYRTNGNRFKENNPRDMWNRIADEATRESEKYIH